VLRIFGPGSDEMRGGFSKLHNEELHNLYSFPSVIRMIKSRRMRQERHVARIGTKRIAYRVLVGKPEGKRPLGRPRCGWMIILKYACILGWDNPDWIDLAQDRDQ
jgi:hypothetical protein